MKWNGALLPLALSALTLAAPAQQQSASAAPDGPQWRSPAGPSSKIRPTRGQMAEVLERVASNDERNHFVVQLDRPLTAHTRNRLRDAGIRLLNYLGGNAYFASAGAELDTARAAAIQPLVEVREEQAVWKLHPTLARGEFPSWAFVGSTLEQQPILAAYVLFHQDVDAGVVGESLVAQLGGRVLDRLESINGLVVELPHAGLLGLAEFDSVMWVEPPLPRMTTTNNSARSAIQADLAQAAPYNLDGSGINVLVYDGGYARQTHVDFGGRLTVRDTAGLSNHATHVSGTIGGSGAAGGGTHAGMAPGVTLQSYGFEFDGSGIFLYTNPGDIESDYDEAINTFGVDISNNSIGTNTEPNGFLCNFQGDYGVTSNMIDSIVRGSLGAPFRIVWANGNERQGSVCDIEGFGDYYSTAPPATAKNHIAVGALNSNNDTMTSFSSWGPTDDGRLKPDISGPGCQSNGDGGLTSTSSASDTAYSVACGTSMASPSVTGSLALLLEDYRVQFPSTPDPRNSTLKALLAQTAVDRGNTGPDYQFGYGSVRIRDAIDHMRTGQFTEDSLDFQGASQLYTITVNPGDSLEVTLAWDDVPGTPNVSRALVNDLDLIVRDPGGTQHFPWTLDPLNPGVAAVQNAADHTNNIEQVSVSSPTAGTWTVEIYGFDIPSGPQPFSIVSSHVLTLGPSVQISFVNDLPTLLTPGVSTTVTAQIIGINDTVIGGSPTLHFRYDGGSFLTLPMSSIGSDQYQVDLPPAICTATPEFYFSAAGVTAGTVTNPLDVPTTTFQTSVATVSTVFSDDFETNQGWSVTNVSLTDGAWERGTPAGVGDRCDPLMDYDGSGQCYLTDNVAGNSDVDGGPTRLTSPTLNLSGANDPYVSYARWFCNNANDADRLDILISDNGGSSWSTVESLPDTSGWGTHTFRVLDHVALTANTLLRFEVADNPNDTIDEAAVDAVLITDSECTASLTDCNMNGIVDSDDIASGRSLDANTNGVPDECEAGDCDMDGVPDTMEPDCNMNGTPDDCETFTDCNSNGIPDECDPDCDSDGTPDDCEPDCDTDGTPDDCEPDCDSDGTPDDCEPDCDSDGIPDDCEPDCDSDGTPDDCEPDCDSDGTPDDCEPDCDSDGIPDDCEPDCDSDTVPDDCEVDCNANGTPDDCESLADCNMNGTPDECETFTDCNTNGIPDECEPDCDTDGIPDDCEPDCDSDGLPDDCEVDCNANGTPDDCESLADCNMNGTPDECETFTDCNTNGIPDECEPDCDTDGIPDDCEPDCDSDGLPDDCEVDCNANGTPDDCESLVDCNMNGTPDECETFTDCNTNGIPDECEPDCDTDGIPDDCEPDCDSDGLPDDCEVDCNANGTPDDCESLADCNMNGTPDECETFTDCNSNGIPDECEPDCDTDGIPDDCEPDCDTDGLPDDCEIDCNANGTPDDCESLADCNMNGTPDECETFTDCNSNGIPDECEPDCDTDGIPDDCEPDCDSDGLPDDCEVDCNANGTPDDCESLADCNMNGTPDECETFTDCNTNGIPDECEPDCDTDGIPDDCEPDCDSDGLPDDCEVDCNTNGTPDDCESLADCNMNGTPDECETFTDCNTNGIPDECEPDCDTDCIPDDCEPDCDSDGLPDDCEVDCNANGTPDDCESLVDCNMNGTPDECETFTDCNTNGIPDECEPDCDTDGIPDDCEPDCDSDGLPDDCEVDCNANGTPDDCESLADCNMNGTPDECETFTDCNTNGIPDECEPDCDTDGIPDDCEPDCDSDGLPDDCEVDCNANGTPDDCESLADCNMNGTPDECETFTDCNTNGIPDECEPDCDTDGIPDDCEPDCDSDGLPDDCEVDCNANGTPDDCESLADCNMNGTPDECETFTDCNTNGIPDECEPDCDTDGIPDDCEPDCDSDGLPDDCEVDCNANGTPDDCESLADCNMNGTPDECETFTDCNTNGIPDECEPDCDTDGIPDDCEPDCDTDGLPDDCETDCNANGTPDDCEGLPDCNTNGVPDECEAFDDCNVNGIPDECETDTNGNGIPDECEIVDVVAKSESTVHGTLTGDFGDTQAGDGVSQALHEVETGGRVQLRTSRLDHRWNFTVAPSTSILVHVRAHHSANSEGDRFKLSWSEDGTNFAPLLTITKTADDGMYQTAMIPTSATGAITIRAEDTDRFQGFRNLDTLFVDHLFLRTSNSIALAPVAPSDLVASSVSSSRIDLTWQDNAGDEDGFRIERSTDGVVYNLLTTVGGDVVAHSDFGLSTATTYHYRVRAFNAAGDSADSNADDATTAGPGTSDDSSTGETSVLGSVRSGDHTSTHVGDRVFEVLREEQSSGLVGLRTSHLEHKWTFNVTGAASVEFHLKAMRSANSDADDFVFAYSTDDVNYTDLLTVSNASNIGYVSASLPPGTSGTVYIRVVDSDRTRGNVSRDRLRVDHMFIRSQ